MNDVRGNSPTTSDVFSDGMNSLTMRDKALLKRSVSKHHNNNFKAGYVPVHEQYLHKTGIRGRKTFAFWTLISLLLMLAVGNLMLTTTILGVLRLGQGMQSLELVPDDSTIKFYGEADLGNVYKRDGKLEGFLNSPINISSQNGSIIINLSRNSRSINKIKIDKNGTVLRNIDLFTVKNNKGHMLFSTNSPNLRVLKQMESIITKLAMTNRIISSIDDTLDIEAKSITLNGAEGTNIQGKEMIWTADQAVYLKSINGSIVLSGKEGTFLDVKKIPIAVAKHNGYVSAQYKVCVCMPEGKLFRIPVPSDQGTKVYCNHINLSPQHNPCI